VLTLQNKTYQSLRKCSFHQAAYKNVQKHTSINHTLAAWCQHLWNKHCKQLLVSPCLLISLNTTLRILIMDQGKIITFLLTLTFSCQNNYMDLIHCSRGTGIKGLMRGMATLRQGNQELFVVRDKVGRPQVSLG